MGIYFRCDYCRIWYIVKDESDFYEKWTDEGVIKCCKQCLIGLI